MKPQKSKPQPPKNNPNSFSVTKTEVYQGAIPPPAMMKAYGDLDPNFPNRIFEMAEREQQQAHSMDKTAQNLAIVQIITGLVAGLLVMGVLCFLVYYSINNNQPKVAIAIVASMATLVGLFLYRHKKK